ncbi:4-hydroxyphenylpyruvate dioxygenase-like [Phragmites australis]|uniref:4-hydroxyphenylpyruvate dioxygenase-like n=1 Tax=Phragmites australis TaxID=29695 RepID=UPI002D784878|nr:4-hydroxyphenylpyruvate dioxygenase-like [Phragmites australis]
MPPTPTTATGGAVAPAAADHTASRFVNHRRFVRANPHTDRFRALAFHHVELWCADAASAAGRFSFALGAPLGARSDFSTGNSAHASLLLRSGSLAFLFTAPYAHGADAATASLPSFSADAARRFAAEHGLAVRAVALRVADAEDAFRASVAAGARPAFEPVELGLGFRLAEVELYGDVVLRYVSYRDATDAPFLPGFEDVSSPGALDYGLRRFDHIVGNVPELAPVAAYVAGFTGFHEFAEFTAEDVGTAESGLNSVVLANNSETVLLPLNEPVHGTKRRSQIQTYLDHHGGPGVQHIALASDDVLRTLREMRARSAMGGFEFLAPPPSNYYDGVKRRAGDVLSEAQIKECQELGVLVDRDDQGLLLQIFTKPVGDRPTLFLEIIQRIGCMEKDEKGQDYQKGGCGGFGKGNFSELFKSIEEYEKSLEAKQAAVVQQS